MRVHAGTNCALRADAVTYWIAAQLRTPVKMDQSMASVLFLLREQELLLFVHFPHLPFLLHRI